MTTRRGTSLPELLAKLVGIATVLSVATVAQFGSPALAANTSGVAWDHADAAVTSVREAAPASEGSLTRARAEIAVAKALLGSLELRRDPAFKAYLDALDVAVAVDGDAVTREAGVVRLTALLRWARATLQADVVSLPAWLAVLRCADPNSENYVTVPAKFIIAEPIDIDRTPVPTSLDIVAMLDRDEATGG